MNQNIKMKLIVTTLLSVAFNVALNAQSTAFTYQGRFAENGQPFTGQAEFQFTLWNASTAGNQLAPTNPAETIASVTNGLFTVSLGWALVWGSVPALALACVEVVFFDAKARREERWLVEKFPDYANYRHRVRQLVPWVY